MLDCFDLQLDRHFWEHQACDTKSCPDRPVSRNTLLQFLDKVSEVRDNVELIASKEINLLGSVRKIEQT